jgi:hypothetical protein
MERMKHDTDFQAWAFEEASKLRAGRLAELDTTNIAEELESLGRSEQQQLVNRLAVLITHILKWEGQPAGRGSSWAATIREQRKRIDLLLKKNPSLRHPSLSDAIVDAYSIAVTMASAETGIVEEDFPANCPYSFEELMSVEFFTL